MHGAIPSAIIRPIIEELPLRTGVSCILSEPLDKRGFVVVAKASAPGQLEITYPIGHCFPRDASAQLRAYLAWSPEREIDAWLEGWQPIRYAQSTLTSLEQIKKELSATRLRGYARSVGEFTEGLTALALPIFNVAGKVAFILDCMGLSSTIVRVERRIAEQMIATVDEIHRLMGGVVPKIFPTRLPGAE